MYLNIHRAGVGWGGGLLWASWWIMHVVVRKMQADLAMTRGIVIIRSCPCTACGFFFYAARVPEAVSRAKELILDLLSRVLAPYLLLITNHFRRHARRTDAQFGSRNTEVQISRYKYVGKIQPNFQNRASTRLGNWGLTLISVGLTCIYAYMRKPKVHAHTGNGYWSNDTNILKLVRWAEIINHLLQN